MRDESVMRARTIDLGETAENIKAQAAITKTQLNVVNLLKELPVYIQAAKDKIEQQNVQKMKLVNSAEGGNL
jgi:hypothetical protein